MSAPTHSKTPPQSNAAAGPVVFFGLIIYVLVAQNPTEPEYQNPAAVMDTDAIARPVEVAVLAPPEPVAPHHAHIDAALLTAEAADFPAAIPPEVLPIAQAALALPVGEGPLGPGGAGHPVIPTQSEEALIFDLPGPVHVLARLPRPGDVGALSAATTPPQIATSELVRVTGLAVNLRLEPGTASAQIAQFDSGVIGMRVAQSGAWSRVNFLFDDPPVTGWMYSTFLEPLAQ